MHAYELLQQHGMRSFYRFLHQNVLNGFSRSKQVLSQTREFNWIMSLLRGKLDATMATPDVDGSMYCPTPSTTAEFFYSHPKLMKLEEIVLRHFESFKDGGGGASDTRVMIFSQYRESVMEIADMLSRHAPIIRVMSFVGHSSTSGKTSRGQTQREQLEVGKKEREKVVCYCRCCCRWCAGFVMVATIHWYQRVLEKRVLTLGRWTSLCALTPTSLR